MALEFWNTTLYGVRKLSGEVRTATTLVPRTEPLKFARGKSVVRPESWCSKAITDEAHGGLSKVPAAMLDITNRPVIKQEMARRIGVTFVLFASLWISLDKNVNRFAL